MWNKETIQMDNLEQLQFQLCLNWPTSFVCSHHRIHQVHNVLQHDYNDWYAGRMFERQQDQKPMYQVMVALKLTIQLLPH